MEDFLISKLRHLHWVHSNFPRSMSSGPESKAARPEEEAGSTGVRAILILAVEGTDGQGSL